MALLGFFALALFIGSITSSKVQLLSTKNALAYANSVSEASSPAYAIDEEVSDDQPTCFYSHIGQYDPDGFSWLVIDLGVVTWNITETYLVLNSSTTDISDLQVFVTTRMHSVAHYGAGMNGTAGLKWHDYSLCGSATYDYHSAASATVHCDTPLHGRWLLVRRHRQPLQVCLLAIYVRKTENQCFKLVEPTLSIYARANEFRQERHISLEQCRESCVETPSCQGLAFFKRSRRHSTGLCRLFRGSTDTDANDDPDNSTQLINCGENCRLEQNECNLGHVFPLIRMEEEDGPDEDEFASAGSIWRIEEPKSLANKTWVQKTLFAIRFKGRIICKAESCGEVLVALVNGEGNESVCSSIDTDLVSVLDRYTIQCRDPVTASDAVAIKLVPLAKVPKTPQFQITNGHARFILTSSRESQRVFPQSHSPDAFFNWSSIPSSTAFPTVGQEIITTENPNDQVKPSGLPGELSDETKGSIGVPPETLFSTTVEGITSIPFESTEFRDENLANAAAPTKPEGLLELANSTVSSDTFVSVNSEDFSELPEPPVDSSLSPQPDSSTSLQPIFVQSRNASKPQGTNYEQASSDPLQNDAEMLPQGVKNSSKATKTNRTVLNLLTAGSGSLSITNLVMIIVIISIVILVALAAIVWCVCTHNK